METGKELGQEVSDKEGQIRLGSADFCHIVQDDIGNQPTGFLLPNQVPKYPRLCSVTEIPLTEMFAFCFITF